jgi:hypothetical protein
MKHNAIVYYFGLEAVVANINIIANVKNNLDDMLTKPSPDYELPDMARRTNNIARSFLMLFFNSPLY